MPKILVVDDDTLRNLIKMRLAGTYEVIDTGDPVQALGLALEHRPDGILLDLMMPNTSGKIRILP
jgi:CheY-like chemotaxis protein